LPTIALTRQERASDGIAAQERNSVGAHDENTSDDKGYDQVKEHPEQGRGDAALEGGIAQCAAGDILLVIARASRLPICRVL
jgi:hypothetical protein